MQGCEGPKPFDKPYGPMAAAQRTCWEASEWRMEKASRLDSMLLVMLTLYTMSCSLG